MYLSLSLSLSLSFDAAAVGANRHTQRRSVGGKSLFSNQAWHERDDRGCAPYLLASPPPPLLIPSYPIKSVKQRNVLSYPMYLSTYLPIGLCIFLSVYLSIVSSYPSPTYVIYPSLYRVDPRARTPICILLGPFSSSLFLESN